ncbi:hypothetical protein Tco_0556562 [Tanacetum coccineum]
MNHSYMMTLNTSPQNKGETIHDYYVRFTKLVNDMQNIKMTMPRMQLNSKFVNNMLPEWGDSSSETEQRLVRNQNDVASCLLIVANIRHMQLEQNVVGFNSVNTTGGQGNNLRGAGAAGNGRAQNRVGNANLSQARHIKQMLLIVKLKKMVWFRLKGVLFLAGADECDAFDLDVDEAPTAQTMFMANLSLADPVYDEAGLSYDSDILFEVYEYNNYQDAVCEHNDAHEMHHDVQPNCVVDSNAVWKLKGGVEYGNPYGGRVTRGGGDGLEGLGGQLSIVDTLGSLGDEASGGKMDLDGACGGERDFFLGGGDYVFSFGVPHLKRASHGDELVRFVCENYEKCEENGV